MRKCGFPSGRNGILTWSWLSVIYLSDIVFLLKECQVIPTKQGCRNKLTATCHVSTAQVPPRFQTRCLNTSESRPVHSGVVTLLWDGRPGNRCSIPVMIKGVSLLQSMQTGCGHTQPSYGGYFSGGKSQGRETAHWFPSNVGVKNEVNCTARCVLSVYGRNFRKRVF